MSRLFAVVAMLLTIACGQATAVVPAPTRLQTHPLPPPSTHPSYPPADLGDVSALAARGVHRQFVGMEDQQVDTCTRAWNKVLEPAGTPPSQIAADLVKVAVDRKTLFNSCGGFIYGTVDRSYCNCYRGDHGLLTIDRGPGYEPAPGMMRLVFVVSDTRASIGDWEVVVDAPDRP